MAKKPTLKKGDRVRFTGLMIDKSAKSVRRGDIGIITHSRRETLPFPFTAPTISPFEYTIYIPRTKRTIYGVKEAFLGRKILKRA